MKSIALLAVLGFTLSGPMLVGCDRTVSEHKSTEQTPNGTVTHEDKVSKDANGNTVHTKDTTVDKNPNNTTVAP